MFVVDIHLNIQNWSQVFHHSLKISDITYHIISGGYCEHSDLLQPKTLKLSLYDIIPRFLVYILCSKHLQELGGGGGVDPVPGSSKFCFSK